MTLQPQSLINAEHDLTSFTRTKYPLPLIFISLFINFIPLVSLYLFIYLLLFELMPRSPPDNFSFSAFHEEKDNMLRYV